MSSMVVTRPAGDPLSAPPAGVPRDRLLAELTQAREARVQLLVGPVGSGKTTLLRQLAHLEAPAATAVVWYPASASDAAPAILVNKLATAFGAVLGRRSTRITQLGTLLRKIAELRTRVTLYIDDAHRLGGRPAAAVLMTLLADAPANLHIVIATQSTSTPSVAGLDNVLRVGYPNLRLRTWEVERLFREVYRQPLPPEAAAELTARLEGWPVAIHLFQLDVRPRPAAERRAAVRHPLTESPLIREFLTTRVLAPLPAAVQTFMIESSALGVLSGSMCDALLGRKNSARLLQKLTDHQALTVHCGPSGTRYRYRLPLQQHLEDLLAERLGPHRTRAHYRAAAAHLVDFGHWPEAYRAFARAEDWVAAAELLHSSRSGEAGLISSASAPGALFTGDPWITLATARRLRGEGRLVQACEAFAVAERYFTDPTMRWLCAGELSDLAHWTPRRGAELSVVPEPALDGLSRQLRDAVSGQPARLLARAVPNSDTSWALAKALAAMAAGRVELAFELLAHLGTAADPLVSLAARISIAVMESTMVEAHGSVPRFSSLAVEAESSGWLWLARLAKAACAVVDREYCAEAFAVREECRALGDHWGAILAGYCLCVGLVRAGDPRAEATIRAVIADAVRLDTLLAVVWLRLLLIDQLRRRGEPVSVEQELLDEVLARVDLPRASSHREEFLAGAHATVDAPVHEAVADPEPPVLLVCLGEFGLTVGGSAVDLTALRRQARTVLRILAIHPGRPVHEERLTAILWPDVALKQAKRRLQVAVSSIRTLLNPLLSGEVVERRGAGYALRLPPGSMIDIVVADELAARLRTGAGEPAELAEVGYRALDLYRGELLSDEGLVEWVLAERDRLRSQTANLAASLAQLEIDRDSPRAAAEVCRRGLQVDRMNDGLWRLLTVAHRRNGNIAAALRAERRYQELIVAVV